VIIGYIVLKRGLFGCWKGSQVTKARDAWKKDVRTGAGGDKRGHPTYDYLRLTLPGDAKTAACGRLVAEDRVFVGSQTCKIAVVHPILHQELK
jgi:hypothetical protein